MVLFTLISTHSLTPLFTYSIISLLHILLSYPLFCSSSLFLVPSFSHMPSDSILITILLLSFSTSLTLYYHLHCLSWSFRRVSQFLQVSLPTGPFGSSTGTRLRLRERQHDTMWCDVMWCDVMWSDMMWHGVMWCDMMWCDMTLPSFITINVSLIFLIPQRPLTCKCVQAIHNIQHLTPYTY